MNLIIPFLIQLSYLVSKQTMEIDMTKSESYVCFIGTEGPNKTLDIATLVIPHLPENSSRGYQLSTKSSFLLRSNFKEIPIHFKFTNINWLEYKEKMNIFPYLAGFNFTPYQYSTEYSKNGELIQLDKVDTYVKNSEMFSSYEDRENRISIGDHQFILIFDKVTKLLNGVESLVKLKYKNPNAFGSDNYSCYNLTNTSVDVGNVVVGHYNECQTKVKIYKKKNLLESKKLDLEETLKKFFGSFDALKEKEETNDISSVERDDPVVARRDEIETGNEEVKSDINVWSTGVKVLIGLLCAIGVMIIIISVFLLFYTNRSEEYKLE